MIRYLEIVIPPLMLRHIRVQQRTKYALAALFGAWALLLQTGCSTLTGDGTAQSVTVETYEGQFDNRIYEAKCKLTNDEGTWTVVTPGAVMIHRSNKLLNVECSKDGYIQDAVAVDSTTKANMFGNIIFGGGIGAIIDHNNGSAYDYPDVIQVPMRKMSAEESRPISDEQDENSSTSF